VKAEEDGLLQPLSRRISGQRLSLFADDIALFIGSLCLPLMLLSL